MQINRAHAQMYIRRSFADFDAVFFTAEPLARCPLCHDTTEVYDEGTSDPVFDAYVYQFVTYECRVHRHHVATIDLAIDQAGALLCPHCVEPLEMDSVRIEGALPRQTGEAFAVDVYCPRCGWRDGGQPQAKPEVA